MKTQIGLYASLLAMLFGGSILTRVEAQEGAEGEVGSVLEEVVVTARRRNEDLQDVPLSVAVFDAEGLELRGVTQISDLDRAVPNATFRGGNIRPEDTANFHIRGVPGVSTYVDGIVVASGQNLLSRGMIEIERVEVLRGPQGTLFGRLASGGAVQLITVAPAEEFGVRGGLRFGEYNQRNANITVDIPISDTLLTKWTASIRNRDGYQESAVADFALGDLNDELVRGDILWQPTADLGVRFNFTNTQFNRNGSAITLAKVLPDNLQRRNRFGLAEVGGLEMSNDFLRAGGNVLGKWETWSSYGEQRMDENAVALDVNWDFSDAVSLRYLGGYVDQATDYLIDNDFTPYNLTDSWRHREAIQRSQELQFLFEADRFSGVVGLYGLEFRPRQSVIGTRDTAFVNDPDAQAAILAARGNTVFDRRTRSLSQSEERTSAIYGEVDFELSDQWQLTLGVRFNEDEQDDYEMLSTAGVSPPNTIPYIPDLSGTNPLDNGYSGDPFRGQVQQVLSSKFDSTTGRAAVRYRVDSDLMVYASYSEGFSAGGFNVEGPPLFPPNTIIPFDPESVDSFEIGVRSDWNAGRLRFNATLFSMNWDDIHLPVPRINPVTLEAERGSWTVNAGAGKIDGLEFETTYRPRDLWQLHFNGAWLDSEYTDIGDTTSVTVGSAFENAPEFSVDIGGRREFILPNGTLTARMQYGWMDDQRLHQDDFRQNIQEQFGLFNAGLTYEPQSSNWSISLSGENLTNQWYTTSGFNSGVLGSDARALGEPRQVSVAFRFYNL